MKKIPITKVGIMKATQRTVCLKTVIFALALLYLASCGGDRTGWYEDNSYYGDRYYDHHGKHNDHDHKHGHHDDHDRKHDHHDGHKGGHHGGDGHGHHH